MNDGSVCCSKLPCKIVAPEVSLHLSKMFRQTEGVDGVDGAGSEADLEAAWTDLGFFLKVSAPMLSLYSSVLQACH